MKGHHICSVCSVVYKLHGLKAFVNIQDSLNAIRIISSVGMAFIFSFNPQYFRQVSVGLYCCLLTAHYINILVEYNCTVISRLKRCV